MNFNKLFVLIMITVFGISSCEKQQVEEKKAETIPAIDVRNMDKSVTPGTDFFKYVNGGWMKNNPIPADESRWGAFNVLDEENQAKLKVLFEEASSGKHSDDIWRKIGDFYYSGLDTNNIEKQGIEPLKVFFNKIDNAKSADDIQKVASEFGTYGIGVFFGYYVGADDKNSTMNIFNLYQGGLTLPDKDYYLENNDRMKKIRDEYKKHITKMFELYGYANDKAQKAAETIIKIETELATVSRSKVDLRNPEKNYNMTELAKLQTATPNFKWNLFFEGIGIQSPASINVGQPEFFSSFSKIIAKYPVDNWQEFLRWKILTESANYIGKKFEEENFNFFGKTLTGVEQMKDRWKRVLNTTNGLMGEAVGKIYVEKYFPPAAKERMLNLVDNLKLALKDRITNLTWMTDVTKEKALVKLEKMRVKIGYPNKWKDYSPVVISRDSYVMNVMNASKFLTADNLNKVGKPVDKEEWHMSPQTVNAYYSPNGNEIVFPAAILQPPFFNLDADDAVNYGAIGVVIGHEMTHGFDDQGRSYDGDGNMTDWWTKEDADKFNQKAQVLVDQFNGYKVINDMSINGQLTLGENIADFGGLSVSLTALKKATNNNLETPKIDDFSPLQRFFLSYSQIWRQNIRDEEMMRRLKEDVHSPGEYRVNGGVVNIPEFYTAFGVKEGDKLFVAPEKRATIW